MTSGRSVARRALALGAVAVALVFVAAVPALAAKSTVTRQDCQNQTIKINGKRLSTAQCLKHVGQSATLVGRGSNLAHTGFEVWILGLLGAGLIGGAVVVRRRASAGTLA
ncbi:MAG: LPXTG cell wall anchor domain-containing protein [Actinobacteria bacterium]|nr:MAG: LPXTG cell wall anchor domain-containing protein [Actinomycetota bacterium]